MTIKKTIASLYEKVREKQLEIQNLMAQIALVQRRCLHPPDKRVVVTLDDKLDRISCDECGKVLQ